MKPGRFVDLSATIFKGMSRAMELNSPALVAPVATSICPVAAGVTIAAPLWNGRSSQSMPSSLKYPRSSAMKKPASEVEPMRPT